MDTVELGYIASDQIHCIKGDDGELGAGKFSVVVRGFHEKYGDIAAKCSPFYGSNKYKEKVGKRFENEVRILQQAKHDNIVKVHGWTKWDCGMAVIMECLPAGNLWDDLLDDDFIPVKPLLQLRLSTDIASGLACIHNLYPRARVIHGDIKAQNILLTKDLRCQVADFGGSRIAKMSESSSIGQQTFAEMHLTRIYTSPEVINNPLSDIEHTHDIYSFSLIMYQILSRKEPFDVHCKPVELILKEVGKGERPKLEKIQQMCSETECERDAEVLRALKDTMTECWNQIPTNRPEMSDVRDKFFSLLTNIEKNEVEEHVMEAKAKIKIINPHSKNCQTVVISQLSLPKLYESTEVSSVASMARSSLAQTFLHRLKDSHEKINAKISTQMEVLSTPLPRNAKQLNLNLLSQKKTYEETEHLHRDVDDLRKEAEKIVSVKSTGSSRKYFQIKDEVQTLLDSFSTFQNMTNFQLEKIKGMTTLITEWEEIFKKVELAEKLMTKDDPNIPSNQPSSSKELVEMVKLIPTIDSNFKNFSIKVEEMRKDLPYLPENVKKADDMEELQSEISSKEKRWNAIKGKLRRLSFEKKSNTSTVDADKEQGKKDELKESIPELDNSTKFATKQLQLNENLASFSKEQLPPKNMRTATTESHRIDNKGINQPISKADLYEALLSVQGINKSDDVAPLLVEIKNLRKGIRKLKILSEQNLTSVLDEDAVTQSIYQLQDMQKKLDGEWKEKCDYVNRRCETFFSDTLASHRHSNLREERGELNHLWKNTVDAFRTEMKRLLLVQEILRSYNAGYRALQDCKNEVQSHKTLLHESYSKFHSVKKIAESFTDVEDLKKKIKSDEVHIKNLEEAFDRYKDQFSLIRGQGLLDLNSKVNNLRGDWNALKESLNNLSGSMVFELRRSVKRDSVEKKAKGSSAKPIEYVDMKPQSNDDENFASAVTDAAASQHMRGIDLQDLECVIGKKGYLGKIVRAGFHKDHGPVAIKCSAFESNKSRKENLIKAIRNEIKLFKNILHENIVRAYGWGEWVEFEAIALIMEHVPNGNLMEMLQNRSANLTPSLRLRLCAEIADGLAYIHNLSPVGLVLDNLKVDNVLLASGLQCKLSDLSEAKPSGTPQNLAQTETYLSSLEISFRDPELLGKPSESVNFFHDVYSYSIVIFEILCENKVMKSTSRSRSYINVNLQKYRPKITHLEEFANKRWVRGEIDDYKIIRALLDLMQNCWSRTVSLRPTMIEVKNRLFSFLQENIKPDQAGKDADLACQLSIARGDLPMAPLQSFSELRPNFPLLFYQRETGFDAETLKLPKTSTRDVQQALPYESADDILIFDRKKVVFYNLKNKTISKLPDFEEDHDRGTFLVKNRQCYVIGGSSSKTECMNFEETVPYWHQLSPLKETRKHLASAVLNDCLYISGGIVAKAAPKPEALSWCQKYDEVIDRWLLCRDMIEGRQHHALTALKGKLYAIGGFKLKTAESFDPREGKWTMIPSTRYRRYGLAASSIENCIYAIGGWDDNRGFLKSVERFDDRNKQWEMIASLNIERFSHGSCLVHGRICVGGGTTHQDFLTDTVEYYNPREKKWKIESDHKVFEDQLSFASLHF